MNVAALTMTQRNPATGDITPETRIKLPITHWVSTAALLLAVGFQGGYFALKIAAQDDAQKSLADTIDRQSASRSAVIEKQREIIDRLTMVAERLGIRQDRVIADVDDVMKRTREIEKRLDRASIKE